MPDAAEQVARRGEYLSNSIHDWPGIRIATRAAPPPGGDWEAAPLDPCFLQDKAPGFPPALAFDKLAFRTGWRDRDHYLVMEGIGGADVSHAHLDVNAVTRLNHLGRHLLVSNGYGRRVGVMNAAKRFSTRVRGPDDHNMLILRRDGDVVADNPPLSALLQRGRRGPVFHLPSVNPDDMHGLATLLAATRGDRAYTVARPAAGYAVIRGPHADCGGIRIEGAGMDIRIAADACTIRFEPLPELPAELQAWQGGRAEAGRRERCR
ncbi:MAG: hypothetical protein JXR37_17455 [Kiritimatiellae bacterium]|nr:hypothetical protein [Kiritimatiellia bacterium]